MEKIWKVVPWIELKWNEQELSVYWTSQRQAELFHRVVVPKDCASQWQASQNMCAWDRWLRDCASMEDAAALKILWHFFSINHLLLEPVSDGIWLLPKELPLPDHAESMAWPGFSSQLTYMSDERSGVWLEVPAARGSLWAEDVAHFERLKKNPTLKEAEALSHWGFDGRFLDERVRDLVPTQDWLWWESVRFQARSGFNSRKRAISIPSCEVPAGEKIGLAAASPIRLPRHSKTDFTSVERLTHSDLLGVLTEVFEVTAELNFPWLSAPVQRLHGPSGGLVYELDAWVWARDVDGLSAGLYRYDGKSRSLERFDLMPQLAQVWEKKFAQILVGATVAPHAVIAIVVDLTKLIQCYNRLALHLPYLNAGVRLGELCTAAEGAKLAYCPVGGIVMRELAVSWGGDPYLYGPLAEFALAGKTKPNP